MVVLLDWLLDAGYWIQDTGYRMQDAGYRCRTHDTSQIKNPKHEILNKSNI
jgi:hypothetical protein